MKSIEDKDEGIQQILKFIRNSHSLICICMEEKSHFFDINDGILQEFKDFHSRGGKIKIITEINQQSISDHTKLQEFCDLRHLENIGGNFALNDKGEFIAITFIQKETGILNIFYSNSKRFKIKQQTLFENLWDKSVDGIERNKELEYKGRERERERQGTNSKIQISINDLEQEANSKINQLIESSKWINVCCGVDWLNTIDPKTYGNILEAIDVFAHRKELQKSDPVLNIKEENLNKRKDEPVWNSGLSRVRWLSAINPENKKIVLKNLAKGIEFRNIEINPVNFIVSDNHCIFAIEGLDGRPDQSRVFFSEDKIYLDHFNNLFERLWKIGQNATARIREDEELDRKIKKYYEKIQLTNEPQGTKNNNITISNNTTNKIKYNPSEQQSKSNDIKEPEREITQIIHNSEEFAKRMLEMTKRTRHDIMLILASSNAFNQSLGFGSFDIFNRLVKEKSTNIRILLSTPISPESNVKLNKKEIEDEVKQVEKIKKYVYNAMSGAKFELIDKKNYYTEAEGMSILIIDHTEVLVWEVNKDTVDNIYESTRLAIYSNSRPLVLSYNSIFDSLWSGTQLFNDLKKANEKISNNERRQREFLDIAAHELRTPIQSIMGNSEMVLEDIIQNTSSENLQYNKLQSINRNASRVNRLLEDFLSVTKIENNILRLDKENTSIYDLVKEVVNDFTETYNNKKKLEKEYDRSKQRNQVNIHLEEPVFEYEPIVNADISKIYQVLSNLITNAIKFSASSKDIFVSMEMVEDTDCLGIVYNSKDNEENEKILSDHKNNEENENKKYDNIITSKTRKMVVVKVKDRGKGIDKKMLPRLFDKFITSGDFASGIGLGLYISKSIVDMHNGKIWAQNNKDGSGTTFSFSLPLVN